MTDPDPDDFKPSGAELVVADREESTVFTVLDRHDEAQILDELQRRQLDVALYDFTSRGTRMVDLSYAGVNEVIRLLNATGKCRIRVRPDSLLVEEVVEDDTAYYVATVYAEDEVTGYGQFGTSTEPKQMKLKGGATKWDPFARTKAVNKAARNALKTMVPEEFRQTLIAQYLGDESRIKRIQAGAGAEQIAELPPALDDEESRALVARAEALQTELQAISRMIVLPAQFQAWLLRSQHSHDALRRFVKYLEEKLAEARESAA